MIRMQLKFFRLGLALIACSATAAVAQDPKPEPEGLTAEQVKLNVESFEYVWNTVNEKYWDPSFGGVDWQAVHDELRPAIDTCTSMRDARRVMRDMISRLKVSHFAIVPREAYAIIDDSDQQAGGQGTVGVYARVIDGRPLIVRVDEGSPAAEAGVLPGWEVVQIDGRDVAEQIDTVSKEYADNPMQRTILSSALWSRLRPDVGETLHVQFRDGDDQLVEKEMTGVTPPGRKIRFGNLPDFYVYIDTRRVEQNIGYIRFNAFISPPYVMDRYNKSMVEYMDADGIIIDLRGNGGGLGDLAVGMIGWLIGDQDEVLGKILIRDLELKMIAKPRPKRFEGPVAVLTDELSVSAAEFMASGVKDTGCGRLIGVRTAGAVLGSRVERLPNGDGFQYAAVNFLSAKTGKMLEGAGVPPDELVEHTRAGLLAGRDEVLDAAVKWIHNERAGRGETGQ